MKRKANPLQKSEISEATSTPLEIHFMQQNLRGQTLSLHPFRSLSIWPSIWVLCEKLSIPWVIMFQSHNNLRSAFLRFTGGSWEVIFSCSSFCLGSELCWTPLSLCTVVGEHLGFGHSFGHMCGVETSKPSLGVLGRGTECYFPFMWNLCFKKRAKIYLQVKRYQSLS